MYLQTYFILLTDSTKYICKSVYKCDITFVALPMFTIVYSRKTSPYFPTLFVQLL